MPYIDFDLDPDDYFIQCSSSEKEELLELCRIEFGLNSSSPINKLDKHRGFDADQFEDNINKLIINYMSLSKQDLEIISTLASKF